MPSTYAIGHLVTVTGTFTDTGGVVGDPTSVSMLYDSPTSTAPTILTRTSTSTGAVGLITKLSTGVYTAQIATTGRGKYEWRYTSTGVLTVSEESWFSVAPRRVTT